MDCWWVKHTHTHTLYDTSWQEALFPFKWIRQGRLGALLRCDRLAAAVVMTSAFKQDNELRPAGFARVSHLIATLTLLLLVTAIGPTPKCAKSQIANRWWLRIADPKSQEFPTNRCKKSPNRTFKSRDLWFGPLFKSQQNRSAEPFKSLVICDSRFESQTAIAPKRAIPDPPILAFFDFLAFFVFRVSLLFLAFFFLFPRILGVPRRERPLLFWGKNPCFSKKGKVWRVRGFGALRPTPIPRHTSDFRTHFFGVSRWSPFWTSIRAFYVVGLTMNSRLWANGVVRNWGRTDLTSF